MSTSKGPAIPLAAISRGVSIVEKRFTLRSDNSLLCGGEVSAVVRDCDAAWASMGRDRYWTTN